MSDPLLLNPPAMLFGQDLPKPQQAVLKTGQAMVFSRPHAGQPSANEDALGIFEDAAGGICLAVADGVGGLPQGLEAASLVIDMLAEGSRARDIPIDSQIETANRALLAQWPNAATTVCVVEVVGSSLVSCHAGDSIALVVGQRGRIKLKMQSHSPVGIQEANGLDEKEALFHPQRHLLNNMMGDPALWLEKQDPLELAPRDTVLIGSDGLWDNFFLSEIVEIIRVGELSESAEKLAETVVQRMDHPLAGLPSKPDDVSFILYRMQSAGEVDAAAED